MTYTPAVQSRITRNTVSVESATLNFPIFVTPNAYLSARVRAYGSWLEVTDDEAIPSTSETYAGLRLAFSQNPAPSTVFLGRQQIDDLTLTPNPIVNSATYSVKFIVRDDATQTPVTTNVSVVSDVDATADEIATLLFTDIDSNVSDVTAVDDTGSVTITADSGFDFVIESLVKLEDTYSTTESAADLLAAIQEENQDWYFMCWSDHVEANILSMAAEIEATGSSDFPKTYFTSTADVDTIIALVDPAIDVIGKLKEFSYTRTICDWHQDADTLFPEMGDVGYNGPFQPGSTTWKFMQVVGVIAASDPITGVNLSTGVQGFIEDRNGGWMGIERGVNFYHEGRTVSGEFIDIIRAVDWLNDEIEVELLTLLLNQKGTKIPNTPSGRQSIATTVDKVLDRAVGFNILSGYIPTTVPAESEISSFDKINRILNNVKWTGFIAGAVHNVIVDGNLTFQDQVLT